MKKRKARKKVGKILAGLVVLCGLAVIAVLVAAMFRFASQNENSIVPYGKPASTPFPEPVEVETEPVLSPSPALTPSPTPEMHVPEQTWAPSISFDSGVANRAAITAMTNYYAADTRFPSGEYNQAAFHTYSDTSGPVENYLIYDWQGGIWKVKDSETWHVQQLEITGANGITRYVSLDVSFNGSVYCISNAVDQSSGETIDGGQAFYVSPWMIEEERSFSQNEQ